MPCGVQKEVEERESRIDRLYAPDAILEDPFAVVGVPALDTFFGVSSRFSLPA